MDNDAATQQQDHRDAFIRVPHFGEKPMRKKGDAVPYSPYGDVRETENSFFFVNGERMIEKQKIVSTTSSLCACNKRQ